MIEFRNGGVGCTVLVSDIWLVLVIVLVAVVVNTVESSNSGVCASSSACVIVTLDGAGREAAPSVNIQRCNAAGTAASNVAAGTRAGGNVSSLISSHDCSSVPVSG